jgi:hypothetical protein
MHCVSTLDCFMLRLRSDTVMMPKEHRHCEGVA